MERITHDTRNTQSHHGSLDTVVCCHCSCGNVWTERLGDTADYRDERTGELDFDAMVDELLADVECDEEYSDDPDAEPNEPEEGDYVLSDCGPLGSRTAVSIYSARCSLHYLGEFADDDTAEAAIALRMKREKFYPSVWTLSDHGNYLNVSERFYREHSEILNRAKG